MIEIALLDAEGKELRRHTFERKQVTVGRNDDNDLVLSDMSVSRRHAVIAWSGDAYVVWDHSSHGVLVNGSRLNKIGSASPDDLLQIGRFLVRLGRTPVSAASAANEMVESSIPIPVSVKKQLHNALLDYLMLKAVDLTSVRDDGMRSRARAALEELVDRPGMSLPADLDRERLIKEVLDETLGLGPLQDLIDDDGVSEIMVVSREQIYVERLGQIELATQTFSSDDAVMAVIERIVTPLGRRIDESSPLVDARLKDGSRVNAVIPPLALKGPTLTIRKFTKRPLSIEDLIRFGTLNERIARFLGRVVRGRRNVLISGGTGSGKTTLLNVLSSFIPPDERVITIEDAAELRLQQPHVVSLETRPANVEGRGEYSIRDLVRNALRMRPDRIVVGECRGGEALDMLQAMNTGHEGSMTTGHSNSPKDMLGRLETMVLMAGIELPLKAIRQQIASALDIIVQQTRFPNGSRKITHVTEVVGVDDDGYIQLEDIFCYRQEGVDKNGGPTGHYSATGYLPTFLLDLMIRGLVADGDLL